MHINTDRWIYRSVNCEHSSKMVASHKREINNMPESNETNHTTSPTNPFQMAEKHKPEVNEETVRALAERLYGISCLEIKELNSYDDRNFKITEDPNMKNPLITNHWPHGYVLKIMNTLDSQNFSFIEAQNETMIFLGNHKINCPKPIRNVNGHYFSMEKFPPGTNHVVRLFEYQPGELLANVPKSDFLFYQVGEYVANMDRLLKKFYHTGYTDHQHLWMLDSVPELEKYKYAVKDPELFEITEQVLKQFKERVVPKMPTLEKGLIHGDFNEFNIIVNLKDKEKKDDWRVSAIIDFGDFSKSCYIFELAIAMAYAMILTGDLKTGGVVLGGYSLIRIIPDEELQLLKVCIAARLCQSMVLAEYYHQQQPSNEYLMASQKGLRQLLPILWQQNEEELIAMWKSVGDDYLTRSNR